MKVLIGYDGTPGAEAVIRDLEFAGLPAVAEACLMVAIPPVLPMEALAHDPTGTAWFPIYAETGEEKARVDAALALGRKGSESVRARFPDWDVKVEARFEPPAQSLLEFAEKWKPHLIAVGSHGWSWLGRALLGSTAEKILAHADANVRLCHPRAERQAGPPRIVAAIDGSWDCRQAIEEIGNRAWPAGTRIKLVAARELVAWTGVMADAAGTGMRTENGDPGRWTWMEKYQKEMVARLRSQGLDASAVILEGDPRHILLIEAEAIHADCLFMGRRGVTGFKRLLLGSVSGAVASHAPCSVEIIRKPVEKG